MAEPVEQRKQARCLLISANLMNSPYPVYPIGVAHIIGALKHHGHLAEHYDVLSSGGFDALESILQSTVYDVIGISIRNIDTVDGSAPRSMLQDIILAIEYVRRYSNAPLVLGGPGFSIMPEELMDYLKADYGIVGEGEIAFPRLIEKIMAKEALVDRLFSQPLADFPDCRPFYSQKTTSYYTSYGGMLNLQTKRGCNYGCSYCSYPTIEGKKLRHRPPEEVVEEFQRLVREFGARYIFFTDAVFNDPDERYLAIAEELIRVENKTPWCAFFRPRNLGIESLRLLKKSGMAALELGTDASTDTTLRAFHKGFSFEEVIALNEVIVGEGLPCAHFIMFGGPDETEDTVREGLSNIAQLNNCVVFAYTGIRILPGTKMYQRAIEDKVISAKSDLISPVFYFSPMVSQEFIDQQLRRSFKGRRDRIYPLYEREHLIPLFHSMGHVGPLWDLLINRSKTK